MKTVNLTAEEKAAKAAAKRERAALKEQKYCEYLEKKEKELLATLTPLEDKEITADIKFHADFYREYTNSKGNKIIEYYELDENANPDEHSLLKVYATWTAYDEKGRKKIEISYYNHFENNLNAAWLPGSKVVYSYNDDGSYAEKHYLNYAANTREGVQERWVLVFTDYFDKDGGLIKKEVNE